MPRKPKEGALTVRSGLRGGLEPIVVTAAGIAQARQDRANGNALWVIAKRLGMSRNTLQEARKRQPELEEALDLGHAEAETELVEIVMTIARGQAVGSTEPPAARDAKDAAQFLLRTRHGYREQGDAGPTVAVQVNNLDRM